MSSVLIRGMEIPTTCRECIIGNPKAKTCIIGKPKMNTKRRDDCPLVEIPTPHGRLGDLDELKSRFRHSEGDSDVDSAWISTIRRFITQADIIIEAEGRDVTE